MAETHKTDLLVIGGGPGGYTAAFRAADLGLQVTLVNADDNLGGTCLLRGCIPSKALLHVAELITEASEARTYGLTFGDPKIDLDALRGWKDNIITRLSTGLSGLVRQRKVTHLTGYAQFENSQSASIEGDGDIDHVEFEHAIIATAHAPLSSQFSRSTHRASWTRQQRSTSTKYPKASSSLAEASSASNSAVFTRHWEVPSQSSK